MVKESEDLAQSSVHVSPLSVQRGYSAGLSDDSDYKRDTSSRSSNHTRASTSSHSQITPPATPNGSQENLHEHIDAPRPVFHNFLRAFYPFHPSYAIADT